MLGGHHMMNSEKQGLEKMQAKNDSNNLKHFQSKRIIMKDASFKIKFIVYKMHHIMSFQLKIKKFGLKV